MPVAKSSPILRLNTLALALLLFSFAPPAQAGDKALAEELFNQAAVLMNKGETAAACEKFAASNEQDPSSGTALNLARCQENLGKSASAWAQYEEAARIARVQGRNDRVKEAQERADEMKEKLSHLTLVVDKPIEGLQIFRGDVEIPSAAWGTRLPTDPGVVVIIAKAPGHIEQKFEVTLGAGADHKHLTIPALQTVPPKVVAPVAGKEVVEPKEEEPVVEPKPEPKAAPNRTLAYVIGGSGIAFLGAGTVFGLVSKGKYDGAEESCGGTTDCSGEEMDTRSSANTFANLSNVAFGLGIVGVGVGTYLFIKAGKSKPKGETSSFEFTPLLSHEVAGGLVSGSF